MRSSNKNPHYNNWHIILEDFRQHTMAYYTTSTNITIFRDEFTNPILHDDEWCTMLWRYYCTWYAAITTFIMEILRSIWAIEFANIIRDATTKLHDVDINFFVGSILIYGCILVLVWRIAGVCVRFVVGLLGSIVTTNDTTESKESTGNTNDPIKSMEADEPSTSSSMGTLLSSSSSSTATPPPLVSEPTGPHTAIEQLRDIRSLLGELQSKMTELESSIVEESSTSSANSTTNNDDSTTDDSTTDDSASNEQPNENNEQIEREPPNMAQAKANAYLWQQNQVAKMKRQNCQHRQQKKGY